MTLFATCKDCGSLYGMCPCTADEDRPNATAIFQAKVKSLEEENRILREALNPHEGVKGLYPLILYFGSREEADEFTDLVQQAKPGMRSYKI